MYSESIEEILNEKLKKLITPTHTSIEEAAQIVANIIMRVAEVCPIVGGDVDIAILQPGENTTMFRASKK